VVSLLRQGLHLNDDQVVIGSGDFAWTLGAALWEAGALTYNNVRTDGWASLTNFHVALALGVVLLLLVMLISVSLFQHRQTQLRRRGYLPLFNPSQSSSKWMPLLLRQHSRLSSSPTSGALAHGEHLVSSLSTCAGCSFCWMSFHSASPVLYLTILAGNLLSLFTKLEIVTLALHIED
jgi:hypothetical protein